MKSTADKIKALEAKRDYLANKKKVLKKFPNAKVFKRGDFFELVDSNGFAIRPDPELMLPAATSVQMLWNTAAYGIWFDSMIKKSNAAFTEEKIWKQMTKKEEKNDKPLTDGDDYLI